MRRHLVQLSALMIALFFVGCSPSGTSKLIGNEAPYTQLTLIDGTDKLIEDYRGRPLVLAFWASTCRVSPRQIEKLNSIAPELRDKGVRSIAVSIDEFKRLNEVQTLISARNLTAVEHAFSGNGVYDETYMAFEGEVIPYLVVIDSNGKIVAGGESVSVVKEYFGL